MINQLFKMNRDQRFVLACSGGSDSMAIASFYKLGGYKFKLAYFNHATIASKPSELAVRGFGKDNGLDVIVGKLSAPPGARVSKEAYWRDERYKFLRSIGLPVVTCHHLDDVVETWLFTALHGLPKIIPFKNNGVFRPFLTNEKHKLTDWCVNHNVNWYEDTSNTDVAYARNRIRHNIVHQCKMINPGLNKVLCRLVTKSYNDSKDELL